MEIPNTQEELNAETKSINESLNDRYGIALTKIHSRMRQGVLLMPNNESMVAAKLQALTASIEAASLVDCLVDRGLLNYREFFVARTKRAERALQDLERPL